MATSSSSVSITPSTAATAAAPQIENPQAISRVWVSGSRSNRPIPTVARIPRPTMATTTRIIPGPRPATWPSESCRPSSTMPIRNSFFAATWIPGCQPAGTVITLVSAAPSTIATSSGLTTGQIRLTSTATTVATAHTASPGRYRATPRPEPGTGAAGWVRRSRSACVVMLLSQSPSPSVR